MNYYINTYKKDYSVVSYFYWNVGSGDNSEEKLF